MYTVQNAELGTKPFLDELNRNFSHNYKQRWELLMPSKL